jgi:hypothetical protein
MQMEQKVILREERNGRDYRYLGAELKASGDLVVEGQDLGPAVERILGSIEYEWRWTVRAASVPLLEQALGCGPDILAALKQQFGHDRADDLLGFLRLNNIPFEAWSRIGD